MALPPTEDRDPLSIGLSLRPDDEILGILLTKQLEALQAVAPAIPHIVQASDAVRSAAEAGKMIGYAGAGSAGLTALSDCLELPGTFGFPPERMCMLYAGGVQNLLHLSGAHEDDSSAGQKDFEESGLGDGDVLIGVSASGSTPYTVGTFEAAHKAGTVTIAIVNNSAAPLFQAADHSILINTPPEIIAGSTRLGAASAQKAALNMMSTLVALRLGHAVRGHMVNLVADNVKLRQRALRILTDLTGCKPETAETALEQAGGRVKIAAIMIQENLDAEAAEQALNRGDGNLRTFL